MMKPFQVQPFNIWAENQAEVDEMRQAFIDFIAEHGKQGRYVSAAKITKAVRNWSSNPLIRNQIIGFFK